MPYDSNEELPDQVTDNASTACQTIFRRAFNSIEDDNPDLGESDLFQRAWGAMQNSCSRDSESDLYTRDDSGGESASREVGVDRGSIAILSRKDPAIVHGVALGEDDITEGASGTRTLWPRETLEEAAEGLQGKKIVDDSEHKDTQALQPPVSAIVGEVTKSAYKPGVGVVFEGEIDDPDVAALVENGRVDVSPALFRSLDGFDEERDAKVASKVHHWRDLSVVAEGASPSNEIQPGAAVALQAEALQASFGGVPDDEQQSDESAESDTDKSSAMTLLGRVLR